MSDLLSLIGRTEPLFSTDISFNEKELSAIVSSSRFLVIGGAGSIGSAVVGELYKRNPQLLHVVDTSENNVEELVQDVRSSHRNIAGEFATFAIDCGTDIFKSFILNGQGYDYVLNLSALKHGESEQNSFALMRMIDVNIVNTDRTIQQAQETGAKKYFCVSASKTAHPVNMMGASKRIMEMFLMRRSLELPVSTARFADVALPDGSLLYGFKRCMEKEQPLSAPNDVCRYFVTPREAGELCLMSCLLGENRDIFFPKQNDNFNPTTLSEIAERYLHDLGYEPFQCATEDEGRKRIKELKAKRHYPVYFFKSDTTDENDCEEFYTENETLDMERFNALGIIKNEAVYDERKLNVFTDTIQSLRKKGAWSMIELIDLFNYMIPEFNHQVEGNRTAV